MICALCDQPIDNHATTKATPNGTVLICPVPICPVKTPRVARSLDDLKAGMVVACREPSQYGIFTVDLVGKYESKGVDTITGKAWWFRSGSEFFDGSLVILSEPAPEPVPVPRHLIDALAEAVTTWPVGEPDAEYRQSERIRNAARAVVHAVEGEA